MKIEGSKRVQARSSHFAAKQQERIKAIQASGRSIINLGRGNPDQATFPEIVTALQKASSSPLNHGYPPYGGKQALKETIIHFYREEYNVDLDLEEVTIFSGSLAALTALPMVLVNPEDTVLTPDPAFFGYDAGIKMAGAANYPLPLKAENGYLPDYAAIPQRKLKEAKLLFLNYPNNPTGAGANLQFFKDTVAFAKEHQIVVAHDFAYSDISFTDKAPSFLQVPGAKEVGVEIYTLSKAFNMAGWRLAFAVGNRQVIRLLRDYIRASVGGTFGAIQDAAIYGLLNSTDQRKELQDLYHHRKNKVYKLLTRAGLEVLDAQGTFFLWIKLPQDDLDDKDFVERLLEDKQVALIPGSVFGKYGKGYVRLSLVSDINDLAEGAKRIVEFIKE
ncbi:aminotransferase class I/II-fold pyridoxal phosphate-dependent enzyme [Streptococcus dentapri]|uniref:Aminotransferase class I/II-fold pyridoxal phosphate-dependent enzyme n=1 Tax=Streptococcus dentapri TaxID=573564 RepID=A0ABV8D2Z7_9STRE